MKTPLKSRIYNYLKSRDRWIAAGKIEDEAKQAGYMGSTATRELKHLVEEGKIMVQDKSKSVEYCAL